ADMKGRVQGIVHDVSASGATVFLEPRELVELNNSIKVTDLEIEREVSRILRELSALIAAQSDIVLAGLDVLAALDGISARATFCRQINGPSVKIHTTRRIPLLPAQPPFPLVFKGPL